MSVSSSPDSSPEPGRVAAVIVAGGSGRRMGDGAAVRKQYMDLLGAPVLLWSLRTFLDHPAIGCTIVVLPPDDVQDPPSWLLSIPVRVVAGGPERGDSVRNGLRAVPEGFERVLIHDAARPLVPTSLIDRVLAVADDEAAVPGMPAADTLKEVGADGRVVRTVDRSRIWLAQTPQGFPFAAIRDAHDRAHEEGVSATDDAALCERYGTAVRLVEGAPENLKITRPADHLIAEALARALRREAPIPPHFNPGE